MGMPVKLSDRLVRAARAEAKLADRSITAQIEHWAKLGRAVEVALTHEDLNDLKKSGGALRRVVPDQDRRHAVVALLDKIAAAEERTELVARIRAGGRAVFGTDPALPGLLVKIDADGTRTPGRLVNRRFVPETSRQVSAHR